MTDTMDTDFAAIEEKMRDDGLPDLAIATFRHHYKTLCAGKSGLIGRDQIDPVGNLPDLDALEDLTAAGRGALKQAVMIKLNGGLGTSMGLNRAKSLLPVKDGLSFLDIIARQVQQLRDDFLVPLPVMFMNSFSTEADTLERLADYPPLKEAQGDLPFSFLQHKVPKLDCDTLRPVVWPDDPEKEWCPPGHGDLYTALLVGGWLDELIARGLHYAFVSNADNLGAVMDLRILGYFAESRAPFMVEVTDRTPMDIKGGHLAALKEGGYLIRESAQCPDEEKEEFQDLQRYRYFNTNNLWLHLPSIKAKMEEHAGVLKLPLILNKKTVDPSDSASIPVYQLETAMGAATTVFPDAKAIRVPRSRFVPVKTTQELLTLRSDLYRLDEHGNLVAHAGRTLGPIDVVLDDRYYKLIDDFEARFPHGAPSLLDCEKLTVSGDHIFGPQVAVSGKVSLANSNAEPVQIPAGALLKGASA